MDIEFHFYMTYLIALRSGFKKEDAYTIAYSSQYTDDNEYSWRIEGGDTQYENLISQTMDITKPQEERLSIYPIFHFCPGKIGEIFEQSSRRDGKYHLLNTIPDNVNSREIFTGAMKSGNLHRIGIGAHMYADTFCHRDFVGYKDEFNWIRLEGLVNGLLDDVLPCIGHALAMNQPDVPVLVWEDTRLISKFREKNNKGQILSAAGQIFDCFCTVTKPANVKSIKKGLLGDLSEAVGEEVEADSGDLRDTRIKNYKDLIGSDFADYSKSKWFDEAVRQEVDPHAIGTADIKYNYVWKGDYKNSNWYSFQEAVKGHRSAALKVLGETFQRMEINAAGGDW